MIRYRVCVLNDFTQTKAFIEYIDYGRMQQLDVSISSGPKQPQQKDDCISIFYDFKKVATFTDKSQAIPFVVSLLKEKLPAECLFDLQRHKLCILSSIDKKANPWFYSEN